jgi:hypothetical protein
LDASLPTVVDLAGGSFYYRFVARDCEIGLKGSALTYLPEGPVDLSKA